MAEVLPELLGPTNTTGLPSSTSTSSNRLKFRTVSLVSIVCPRVVRADSNRLPIADYRRSHPGADSPRSLPAPLRSGGQKMVWPASR